MHHSCPLASKRSMSFFTLPNVSDCDLCILDLDQSQDLRSYCIPVVQWSSHFHPAAMALSMAQRAALLAALRLTMFGISLEAALQDPQFSPGSRDLDVAEVFTTAQAVVKAGLAAGLAAEPYDIKAGHGDACTAAGFQQAMQLILRLRPGGLAVIAPDCSSFGFACRAQNGRRANRVQGDTSRPFVREGNLMARMAMFLYCLAVLRGAEAIMENPVGSMLFSFLGASIQELTPLGLIHFFYVARCTYDDEAQGPGKLKWLKRYKFMCSGAWLRPLVLPCSCTAHRPLMDVVVLPDGSKQTNGRTSELAQSGLYPPRLGAAIVATWQARSSGPVVQLPKASAAESGRSRRSLSVGAARLEVPADADPWDAVPPASSRRRPPRIAKVVAGASTSSGDTDPWSLQEPDPWI